MLYWINKKKIYNITLFYVDIKTKEHIFVYEKWTEILQQIVLSHPQVYRKRAINVIFLFFAIVLLDSINMFETDISEFVIKYLEDKVITFFPPDSWDKPS